MRVSDRIRGLVRAEVIGAFPESFLNAAAASDVLLWDIRSAGEMHVVFCCYETQLPLLRQTAEACGCELKLLRRTGGSILRGFLRRRALLLSFACLAAVLLLTSSLFVWSVEVRGAEQLSRGEILRALEDAGLGVGSFWPGLSTDLLRGEAMQRLPALGWMSVNVCGSRAIVLVREREARPLLESETGESALFAARSGLVRRVSLLSGIAQVQAGQVVSDGQLLAQAVPGAGRARGSVVAETWRELSAVCPKTEQRKQPHGLRRSRFALVFGKRRINLYFSSGKAIDGCDKIVSEYTLGRQGLFAFPVRVVREEIIPYRLEAAEAGTGQTAARLMARLENGLEGQILEHSLTAGEKDGLLIVTLRAHCMENIALAREGEP